MDEDEKKKAFEAGHSAGYQKGKSEILKEFTNGYRSGYGQARADLIQWIEEAMASCQDAAAGGPQWQASADSIKEIRLRRMELQRIRAMIKALKPNIAGG